MTDFSALIADLRARGMTPATIAEEVGAGTATIYGLEDGATKQPRYELGVALVALHARVTKRKK